MLTFKMFLVLGSVMVLQNWNVWEGLLAMILLGILVHRIMELDQILYIISVLVGIVLLLQMQ